MRRLQKSLQETCLELQRNELELKLQAILQFRDAWIFREISVELKNTSVVPSFIWHLI